MEYMSEEGYAAIVAELDHLVTVELAQAREAIAEARAQGDLSENYEYRAAKREQARILSRIRYRQRILQGARVIDPRRLPPGDTVRLLSTVGLTDVSSRKKMRFTITSPHEADISRGKLSIHSPVAKALLGKKAGDRVSVSVPAGTLTLVIDKITM